MHARASRSRGRGGHSPESENVFLLYLNVGPELHKIIFGLRTFFNDMFGLLME